MSKCNFNSYEGSKNFIFISYAHKDSEQVYPIIESLNARGYRVWYDDGISPGSEWPEYIARHIDMCDTVIFFASPNSVASENCRREINFTISRNKKFLCIILEPTDFSLGMELQLSSYQSVMKYEYPDDESFFNKLLTTNLFNSCLRDENEEDVTDRIYDEAVDKDIAAHKEFEKAVSSDNSETVSFESTTIDTPVSKAETTTPSFEDNSDSDVETNQKKKKKFPFFIFPIVLVIIILVFIVGGVGGFFVIKTLLSGSSSVNNDEKIQITANYAISSYYSSVFLNNDTVTPESISQLNKLDSVTTLSFTDCTFTDGTDLGKLKDLENITSLSLHNCTGITDYSFLQSMTSLSSLSITDTMDFKDLTDLPTEFYGSLDISNTGVTNLDPLSRITSMYSVDASNCNINNISPALTINANEILLSNCGLTDASFLKNCNSVSEIDLSGNPIDNLEFLDPYNSSISYISSINLSNTNITEEAIPYITVYSADLRELYLDNISIKDPSFIGKMTALTTLSLSGCGLEDLSASGIEKLTGLEKLNLSNNELKDIPALSLKSEFSFREQTINVSNNKLTSLSFLENSEFSTLIAYKNNIDYDNDTIDKVFKLTADGERKNTIVIDYSANLLSISSLGYFDNIYIANCPIDKMSDFSNTFTDSDVELSYTIEELDAFNEYSPLDMLGWHSYNLLKHNE